MSVSSVTSDPFYVFYVTSLSGKYFHSSPHFVATDQPDEPGDHSIIEIVNVNFGIDEKGGIRRYHLSTDIDHRYTRVSLTMATFHFLIRHVSEVKSGIA